MSEYPIDHENLLKGISEENTSNKAKQMPSKSRQTQGLFSQMVSGNPFSCECRLITTSAKDRKTQPITNPTLQAPKGEQEEEKGAEDIEEDIDEKGPGEQKIMIEHSLTKFRTKDSKLKNQIICSPGLNLIKSLVKYIELLHILKPCTETVLNHLMGIYEFYAYCVFLAFTPWEYQQKLLQKYPIEEPVDFEKVFSI